MRPAVPYFTSLRHYVLARNRYLNLGARLRPTEFKGYMPGPERHDLFGRLRRHGYFLPGFYDFRYDFEDTHKPHIDTHKRL